MAQAALPLIVDDSKTNDEVTNLPKRSYLKQFGDHLVNGMSIFSYFCTDSCTKLRYSVVWYINLQQSTVSYTGIRNVKDGV